MSLGRRNFLTSSAALGASSLLGFSQSALALGDPPPEVQRIRLVQAPVTCLAPQYLAEDLLHLEGFSKVDYVQMLQQVAMDVAEGRADMAMWGLAESIAVLDADSPIVLLAGIHAGCWELFGNKNVESVRDLRGKAISIIGKGTADHVLTSSMLAYIGLDPNKDVHWVHGKSGAGAMRLFIDDKADAFMGFPPQPQELRAKKIGRLIVDTAIDKPWSQYFCCVVVANRDFVRKHPVATKRALRAFLKAADICASEPERAVRFMAEKGYERRQDYALDMMKKLPYDRWRQADPEDSLRFLALRLYEVGMIKTSPNKLIARGTDWRFLNELKKELKA